jgi:P pilus assembly chaperone PapD
MKIFLFLFLAPLISFAFKVEPMVAEMKYSGSRSTQTFKISNQSAQSVAIEVESTTRDISLSGDETRKTTKDFMIYPFQFKLLPGKERVVRVTWIGKVISQQEAAYRLLFRQLPVEFDVKKMKDKKNQIQFLLEYVASLYIAPEDLKLQARPIAEKISFDNGQKVFAILLDNPGNQHALLNDYEVYFTHASGKVLLNDKEFQDLSSTNILANTKRELTWKTLNTYNPPYKLEISSKN